MSKLFYILTVLVVLAGCKKNTIEIDPLATVSVVNLVVGGKVVKMNTNLRDSCLNMNYKHFSIVAGSSGHLTVYPNDAPGKPYFSENATTAAGDLYTLFLTGTQAVPESVMVKDAIPVYPTEDVINVRFVNLSPGSVPLSLTLGNDPKVNVFTNLAYKQVSEFKTLAFPAILPTGRNQFQLRNEAGTLLFTYTMPATGTVSQASSRHRNISICVKGIVGGTGTSAFGVVVLPHY